MAQQRRAKQPDKDLVSRLAGAGEEAVQRLGELPGGKALLETAQSFRERLDELAARIRTIDPLEKRVTALEARLAALEKKAPGRTTSSTRTTSTGRKPTTKSTP